MEDIGLIAFTIATFLITCCEETEVSKIKKQQKAEQQTSTASYVPPKKTAAVNTTPPVSKATSPKTVPKPTPPANPKPSKPITNPEQPKTPSGAKTPKTYEHTYSHTCLKCGKTFYNSTANPEVKLCSYCEAKIAVEHEKKQQQNPNPNPGKYFHTCQRCAKDFWSDNASAELCDSCKALIKASKDLGKKNPQYKTYTITCQKCGKSFESPYPNPANKLCTSCTAAANAEKNKTIQQNIKKQSQQQKVPVTQPPQKPAEQKLEFGIFACPKCGANNRGPKGKILTCGNPNCKNKFKAEG